MNTLPNPNVLRQIAIPALVGALGTAAIIGAYEIGAHQDPTPHSRTTDGSTGANTQATDPAQDGRVTEGPLAESATTHDTLPVLAPVTAPQVTTSSTTERVVPEATTSSTSTSTSTTIKHNINEVIHPTIPASTTTTRGPATITPSTTTTVSK